MSISRRAFLRLLGLAPAVALMPKVAPASPDPESVRRAQFLAHHFGHGLDGADLNGIGLPPGRLNAMHWTPDGDIYVGGAFSHFTGGLDRITHWDGGAWEALGADWQGGDVVSVTYDGKVHTLTADGPNSAAH